MPVRSETTEGRLVTIRRLGRTPWPMAGVIGLIGLLTLTPQPVTWGPPLTHFSWCLACGDQAGNDVVNNVLLFMPLGAVLVWRGWTLRSRLALALTLSLTIELLQVAFVPGRFGSLSDILTNTAGASAGGALVSRVRVWARPAPAIARRLALGSLALAVTVLTLTAYLLHVAIPSSPLYGQWTPNRGVPFAGRLLSVDVNGRALPKGRLPEADATAFAVAARSGAVTMHTTVTASDVPIHGFAPVARLVSPDDIQLAIGQTDFGFAFVPALRSRRLGLRTLRVVVAAPGLKQNEPVALIGRADRQHIELSVVRPSGVLFRRADLTLGLGWTFLLPGTVAVNATVAAASALWLALLALPCAFYAARASQFGSADRDRRGGVAGVGAWLCLTPAALSLVLAIVPRLVGCAPTSWQEWAGAAAGCIAGTLAAFAWRTAPLRSLSWQIS